MCKSTDSHPLIIDGGAAHGPTALAPETVTHSTPIDTLMHSTLRRHGILSRLIVLASMLAIVLLTIPSTGRADGIPELLACGTSYKVDITALAGTSCTPLGVHTVWGTTPTPTVWPALPSQYPTPGIYFESPTPTVPAGTPLTGIAVCGQAIPPVAGYYTVTCANGCKLCVAVCFPSGCLVIKIAPGSCANPASMLPCP